MALMNAANVPNGGGKKSDAANPNNAVKKGGTSNQTNSTTSSTVPLASNPNTAPTDDFNYIELKRNVAKIIDYLQKSSNNLQRTINDLNNYYVVNGGKSELQSQLETLKKDIVKTSDYLSSNVITEINKKL